MLLKSTLLSIATLILLSEGFPISSSLHSGSSSALPSSTEFSSGSFPTDIDFLGPTSTAEAPFLAQTDDVAAKTGKPSKSYTLPQPFESAQAYDHKSSDQSIFEMMGTLSPYYVSDGFGVYDYGLPDQCKIKQVHMLSRHGSRYPDSANLFGTVMKKAGNFTATGNLSFLNEWEYDLGVAVLTNLGNQQLFDKGVRSFFRYGGLYDFAKKEKIVARTTSEERMTMSALYFLNGFFGLNWDDYVNLELQIEDTNFTTTLAPWNSCPNNNDLWLLGDELTEPLIDVYLKDAVKRFNKQIKGDLKLTTTDAYNMQALCAYETNTLGYSKFCSLFSQKEWEWYGYIQDVDLYYGSSFGNPTSRAGGIGYVTELWQRLTNTPYNETLQTSQNATLDSDPVYFPMNQSLYLDFTHDTVIMNILTAMGLEGFKSNFTLTGPSTDKQDFKTSKIVPFAAQFFLEVIECDEAVPANRSSLAVKGSKKTSYVHAVLNDHTISLSDNLPDFCDDRVDGWCQLESYIDSLEELQEVAEWDLACFGNINSTQTVYDGVPLEDLDE